MSYVDEEKRAFCISKIIEHLNTLDTWEKFKTFVNGITSQKIKTKLKEAYLKAGDEGTIAIESAQTKKDNDESMAVEIDSL
ncbi:hypothetical protein ES703_14465 [subsurface metagenome]